MGWEQRAWYLGEHAGLLFDTNGNAGPTVWCDGRAVGGRAQHRTGEVASRRLEDVGNEAATAIEREAARLVEWLGDVRMRPASRHPCNASWWPAGTRCEPQLLRLLSGKEETVAIRAASALVRRQGGGVRERSTRSRRYVTMVGSTVALVGSGLICSTTPVQAAFPGATGVIACSSNRDGNFEIYTFSPNGTEQGVTRLTNLPSSEGRPRYSPDGRKIAFESNMDGPQEIYIMNADGTNIRRLTFSGVPGVHGNSSPAWSPGGDQIAYQTTRHAGSSFDVYRIDIDGTNDTRLTNLPAEESLPAWDPLGYKIAYSSRAVDPSANVHLMNPDGTGQVSLPPPGNLPGTEDSWPSWSPDGSMIAFHSRRDDPTGEEIYRMNRDGSNVVKLTNNPGAFDIFPAWSPDGTRILWNSQRDGAANFGEVFTMNASDGGNIIRITNNEAVDQRCDWQPICSIYGAGDILGTPGNDVICGSDGPDRISGGGGNDIILGLGGDDQIAGNRGGNDRIFGGAGNDRITGQGGTDIIDGGIGVDQCVLPTRNCP